MEMRDSMSNRRCEECGRRLLDNEDIVCWKCLNEDKPVAVDIQMKRRRKRIGEGIAQGYKIMRGEYD